LTERYKVGETKVLKKLFTVNGFCHKREELMPEVTQFNTLEGLCSAKLNTRIRFFLETFLTADYHSRELFSDRAEEELTMRMAQLRRI
jgi:hypothetical protein